MDIKEGELFMSLSLILLPDFFFLQDKENEISEIVRFASGKPNIQLIVIKNDKLNIRELLNNKNISIVQENELKLGDITADYVLFLDRSAKFSNSFFDVVLSVIENEKQYDFFQLLTKERSKQNKKVINVFEMDYENISSIKILKKNLLESLNLFNFTQVALIEIYFELFMSQDIKYKILDEIYYRNMFIQDKKFIISEGKKIHHLLFSKDEIHLKKLITVYKKPLVEKLFHLIDNRNFSDLLPYDEQEFILNILKKILLNVDNKSLKNWRLNGYIPFADMIREGLFTEGLYYIRILRGKRYWYNTTKSIERKIKNYPIEESLSWKVTAPLRKSAVLMQKLKQQLSKWGVQILSFPVKLRYFGKEVWLVSERADQAEDNGYNFFKYCREHYPDQPIFYLINEDSPHVEKIRKLGNIIYHSSLKHWIYMLIAKKYISAWVFKETSYPESTLDFEKMFERVIEKKQHITLQHGVIIHNIAPYLSKNLYHQSLFIASSKAEKEVIKNTLEYDDKEVVITGLSRFDNLHDIKIKRQILIMPTWRRSLFRLNESEFLQSDYFYRYYHLVRNERLLKLIEQENIYIKFYIHNQMQHFINEFAFNHPNITFLTKQNSVVSELLQESALLITDYSSVMADFLYMEKPTLLYQFDPYNNHHGPVKEISYADFGEIVCDEEVLVEKIYNIAKRNFLIDKKYKENSGRFFLYKDNKNSERIFREIRNLTN